MRKISAEIKGAYEFARVEELVNEFGTLYRTLMSSSKASLKDKREADSLDKLVCVAINEFIASE